MKGHYADEKLSTAVSILATSDRPLRERLQDTYEPHLWSLKIHNDFPWPDLEKRFHDLMNDLAPNGRIDIAVASWSEIDLRRMAEEVVSLSREVARRVR